jgi:phosphatidylglycerol:prolipoprotein diacylglycerol transferase
MFVGMLLGARLIYMLVYYEATPDAPFQWWTPFAVWEGGLASHGAVLGMVIACILFGKVQKVSFWNLTDTLALAGSQGIFWGRLGNFINSELVGRPTSGPMGMQFPVRNFEGVILGWTEHRHPAQIYAAVMEGLLPFVILWLIRPKVRNMGVLGGIWLCLYAVSRVIVEFFREKDQQMPYYFGFLTMGQILSVVMFLCGIIVIVWNQKKARPVYDTPEPSEEEVAA